MSPPPVNKTHCCASCRKKLEASRLQEQRQHQSEYEQRQREEEGTNAVTREELDQAMRRIRLDREHLNPTPRLPDLNDIIVPTNAERQLRLNEPTRSHHDVPVEPCWTFKLVLTCPADRGPQNRSCGDPAAVNGHDASVREEAESFADGSAIDCNDPNILRRVLGAYHCDSSAIRSTQVLPGVLRRMLNFSV